MSLDDECCHNFLLYAGDQKTGELDECGVELSVPLFTCYHPSKSYCGTTLMGFDVISAHPNVFCLSGKNYYAKPFDENKLFEATARLQERGWVPEAIDSFCKELGI